MNDIVEYMINKIREELVGYTIKEPIADIENESFGFQAVKGKKRINVWVECDEEGNGPGWLYIEKEKK